MGGLGNSRNIAVSSIQIWEQSWQSQIRHSTSPKCFLNHPSLQTLPSQEAPRGKQRVCIAYATDPCPCCLEAKSGVPAWWIKGMERALGKPLGSWWLFMVTLSLPLYWVSPSCESRHVPRFLHLPQGVCQRQLSWCSSTAPCCLYLGQKSSRGGLAAEPGLEPLSEHWSLDVSSFSLQWRQSLFANLYFSRAQNVKSKDILWFK